MSGLTAVDQKLSGTTTSMANATAVAIPLAAAATAVGAGFLSSIDVASDFEHQMNGIKAVMSPAEVLEFGDAVEDLAMKLGSETVFSSSQAAGAIEELIKAGVPLSAILGGAAASALDLASATGTDVSQAANFAATAMNTFHLSASELPAIMDTISNVSNAVATDVGGLQLGFAQIGPVAAGLGISFADTAQALGIFAQNGLKGSDAGTSLKTMLLNLDPSTKAQTAAFKELGLITADGTNQFFDATGSAKSMSEIFEILKQSTSTLTDQQKINLLQTAFGTDAVRAATIAASEGAAGWDKVTESMDKMGGVQVAAAQRNAGLEGAMNSLGGSIETVQITIGNLFLPILTAMAQGLTVVINAFSGLDPNIQTAIIAVVGIAGAVAGLVAAFVLLGPVFAAAGAGFAIITAAAAPVLIPILAIAAAVAALKLAWDTDFAGIQGVTAEVWAAIQPMFENIKNLFATIVSALAPFVEAFRGELPGAMQAFSDALGPLLAQLPNLIRMIGDFWNAVSAIIQLLAAGDFSGAWDVLVSAVTVAAQNVGNALGNLATFIGDWLASVIPGIIASAPDVWAAFIASAWEVGVRVAEALGNVLTFIGDQLGQAIPALIEALPDPWEPFLRGAWEIGTRIAEAFGNFMVFIGETLAAIPALIQGLGDFFGPFIAAAWEIGTRIAEAFGNFLNFIGTALAGIPDLIMGLGDFFGPFVNAAWEIGGRLAEAFANFLDFIGTAISGIPAMIEGLGDVFGPLVTAAWNLGGPLGDAIMNAVGFVGQAIQGIPTFIEGLGDIFGPIVSAAYDLQDRIAAAIEPIKQLLANTFGAFWEWLTGAIQVPTGGGTGTGGTGGTTTMPGPTGPIVSVGTLIISTQAEADAFLQQVADAVLASARRVTPPATGATALP
jgi:TP901 family phage tail tape measure protein